MEPHLDKICGIAVGAVAGDALGMPLEFKPARPLFDLETEMVRGPLPRGNFTDDTEMSLAVAESLLLGSPIDPADLAARFYGWYRSRPTDVGIHTQKVLKLLATGLSWQEATQQVQRADPESAGNGSLMRSWPIAIARWNSPSLLVAESRLQSEITHPHQDCMNACVFVNLIIRELIHRDQNTPTNGALRQAIATASNQVDLGDEFRIVVDLAPVRLRDNLTNSGWVRHTVESSLWAVLTTRSFEEALIQAVNLGNDADTTGCVTGAIAGALYGENAIPHRWKDAIHGEYPLKSGKLWFYKDFYKLAIQLSELDS